MKPTSESQQPANGSPSRESPSTPPERREAPHEGPLSGLLAALARWAHRRSGLVLAGFGGLLLLAALGTWRLSYDTDVLSLLPREDPSVALFADTVERFGSMDRLLVAVRVPPGEEPAGTIPFVDRLARELEAVPAAGPVDSRLPDPQIALAGILPLAPFFLAEEDLGELEVLLEPAGLELRAKRLRRELSSPLALAMPDLPRQDPLGLAPRLLRRVASGGGPRLDWSSGYWLSARELPADFESGDSGGRLFLITSRPPRPAQDVAFSRALVAEVEAAVERARESVLKDGPERSATAAAATPEVLYAGGYFTAVDDASQIQGEVVSSVLTSLAAVTLLLLYAFRRFSAQLLAMLPLACGTFLTFGLAGLAVGRLSHATSGVAALLIGLGVDFTIVSYDRWLGERGRGRGVEDALAITAATAGRAVVVGAVTTAATFGAFAITGFPGLRQMGWLTALGIGACAAAVLVLLPALLTRFESGGGRAPPPRGAARLLSLSLAWPRTTLLLAGLLSVLALALVPRLGFEEDLDALRPAENRGIQGAVTLARHFGFSQETQLLVIQGESLAMTLEASAAADRACAERAAAGHPIACLSPSRWLPEPRHQARALEWLETLRRGASPEQRRQDFEIALRGQGLSPAGFSEALTAMEAMLTRSSPLSLQEVAQSPEGAARLGDLLRPASDEFTLASAPPEAPFRALIQVLPAVDDAGQKVDLPPRGLEEMGAAARAVVGDRGWVQITGSGAVGERMTALATEDAPRAALLGLLLVALLLRLDLRTWRDVALVLSPVLLGLLWMFAAMVALGLQANMMNLFAATMVVGIGVDYGLHVVHRYRDEVSDALSDGVSHRGDEVDPAAARRALGDTAEAVLLAALSTIAGFGTLALSNYPGLASTGAVAILGALASVLAALTVLPAMLRWGGGEALESDSGAGA
ncbi:MAG: efflux RND transporter permease subunit [Acidobacteriota bacterium]